MNLFNRVLIFALSVVLLLVGLATFLVTIDLLSADALPIPGVDKLFASAAGLAGYARTRAIIISLVLVVASTILIILEIIPFKRTKSIDVQDIEGGTLTIATRSISKMAAIVATDIEGVESFTAGVKRQKEGILLTCRAILESGSNMVEVGTTIQDEVKEAIETNTGITVVKVDLNLKLASSRRSGEDYI
jgi:uncharacterized alkaline shock family protein YloU